jgi:hypothetical protein
MRFSGCGDLQKEISLRQQAIEDFIKKNKQEEKQTVLFATGREAGIVFAALLEKKLDINIVFLESIPQKLIERNETSWLSLFKAESPVEELILKDRAKDFPKNIPVAFICSHKDPGSLDHTYAIVHALSDTGHEKNHVQELYESPKGEYSVHCAKDQFLYFNFVMEMYGKYMILPIHVSMLKG